MMSDTFLWAIAYNHLNIAIATLCFHCDILSPVCSYSIMRECWNDDKESRPIFMELKDEFDCLISNKESHTYLCLKDVDLAAEGPSLAVDGESPASPHSSRQQAEAATEEPAV